jgi:phosphoribosylformylglycinamidine synthase
MFDDAYALNPLVNAFALGLVRRDQIFYGRAVGVGNPVLYVGAKTGRDGIHGATMASAEFDDEALGKRPTVQVGDPFLEKLLLEACLEAMRSGAVAGIQDMGAAGLTSSSCEMAARAGTGLEIDLTLVPQREQAMSAYEIMLSESQERMLIVAHKGRERQVMDIFKHWELDAVVIGRVTDTGNVQLMHHEGTVADIPVVYLTDEAPLYERPMRAPERRDAGGALRDAGGALKDTDAGRADKEAARPDVEETAPADAPAFVAPGGESPVVATPSLGDTVEGSEELDSILSASPPATRDAGAHTNDAPGADHDESLRRLLGAPNIASKEWVYRQYDHMVRTNTAVLPGADAAIVRIKETRRALAMCLDGNGRYSAVDPREGARQIVAESARNVVCVGARPIAVTNCLNFPSPERPEVMWAFSETIEGMAEACRAFDTPVISGNVSFYNETEGRGILPTPVIGMVGVIEDVRRIIQPGFKREGDLIALLGQTGDDLSVSEYAATVEGRATEEMLRTGRLARLDLKLEQAVQAACLQAADESLLRSAHDAADGGLSVAIAESCFSTHNRPSIGATVDLAGALHPAAQLFAETPSRIVVSFAEEARARVEEIAAGLGCPLSVIGRVGGAELRITIGGQPAVSQNVNALESLWRTSLGRRLQAEALAAAAE